MALVRSKVLFAGLKAALEAIPLDAVSDPDGAKLFDAVEQVPNKRLATQMEKLLIGAKKRVCLIVPMALHKVQRETESTDLILQLRYWEVSLVFTDVAYFKAGTRVMFGSDTNPGLLDLAETVEQAVEGKELSNYGGVVFQDGGPLSLAEKELPETREVWEQTLMLPAGDTRVSTF